MVIIGELINSTRRQVLPLLQGRQSEPLVDLARRQLAAGAHLIDVNCAALMHDEAEGLEWAVRTIQGALDVGISLDSPNPHALKRGLEVHRGRALVNSISLERDRWNSLLPLVQEFRPQVIALSMDDQGIPSTAEGKLDVAGRLVDALTGVGLAPDEIYVDPLLLPISTDTGSVTAFLKATDLIRDRYPGVHLICGLSNVSYGLPLRPQINQVFLILALAHGVDAFILDPLDRRLMADLTTARMLLGQDEYCREFIGAVRAGKFEVY